MPSAPSPARTRSRVLRALAIVLSMTFAGVVVAQSVVVPVGVQADLLVKVVAYDKNLARRAVDRVRIAIVELASDNESVHVASQLRSALHEIPEIARLPHEETIVDFSDAAALAAGCRSRHDSIVYIGPGLAAEIDAIRRALDGEDLMSVAAVPEYVQRGIVLGFGLHSGRPKLLFNITQARKQKVDLRAEALRLMTVFE